MDFTSEVALITGGGGGRTRHGTALRGAAQRWGTPMLTPVMPASISSPRVAAPRRSCRPT